jgi:hypothetical protein
MIMNILVCAHRVSHRLVILSDQERNFGSPRASECIVDCTNEKSRTIDSLDDSDAPGKVRC